LWDKGCGSNKPVECASVRTKIVDVDGHVWRWIERGTTGELKRNIGCASGKCRGYIIYGYISPRCWVALSVELSGLSSA